MGRRLAMLYDLEVFPGDENLAPRSGGSHPYLRLLLQSFLQLRYQRGTKLLELNFFAHLDEHHVHH